MSDATNSGTFSVTYNDSSFSAAGSFSSANYASTFGADAAFGEIGTERNGSFVRSEDRDEGAKTGAEAAGVQLNATAAAQANSPKFKGRIPIEYVVH